MTVRHSSPHCLYYRTPHIYCIVYITGHHVYITGHQIVHITGHHIYMTVLSVVYITGHDGKAKHCDRYSILDGPRSYTGDWL